MDAGPTLRVAITYENTGSTQQDDVVVRAQVPVGLQGVGGTTWIRDSANPDGLHVNGDVFSEDGINIDTRDPGDVVHVWFDAIVTDRTSSYYDDGFYQTQYNVLRSRSLALRAVEALEKTGKVEVIPPSPGTSFSLSGLSGMVIGKVAGLFSSPTPAPVTTADAEPDEKTAATARLSGKVSRFVGSLSVVPVRNSVDASGPDWIGLKTTNDSVLKSVSRVPLFAGFFGLALLLLALGSTWYREGR